jgi:ATP-dependent helicase HepA
MNDARHIGIGAFAKVVEGPHREKGIGKVARIDGMSVVMRYFDIPDDSIAPEVVLLVSQVREIALPAQTRVFMYDRRFNRWRVGRVLEDGGSRLTIQFPNRDVQEVAREDVETRWRQPIIDPTIFLARGVNETPRFAYARSDFMRAISNQRAASLGMSAVLSSRIQLADYQYNVVKQVLQDPVQRYLLADEVGLGKTIEAGILIRQYLLDGIGTARVMVIVPGPLVAQWRRELRERFMLADYLGDFLHVIASTDIDAIDALLHNVGMLVVDEAHHLSRRRDGEADILYERLRERAGEIPCLLLLSATPVLADTAGFLRMLHLLDPAVFPLEDLSGFERRIASRQLIAEVVATLTPEHVLSMEDELDRLESAFGDDPALQLLVETLRPVVQGLPDEDDPELSRALGALRAHLTETYRLHRRILRNRRRSVPWATPRRSGLQVLTYRCSVVGERARALDELRVHLVNLDVPDALMQLLFVAAMNPASAGSIAHHLSAYEIDDHYAYDLASHVDRLAGDEDASGARIAASIEAVGHLLEGSAQQIVMFCDLREQADRLCGALQVAFPGKIVQRHVYEEVSIGEVDGDDDSFDAVQGWHAFLLDPERCRVLVCDSRAEEGLNLHGGRKVLFHYDLPVDPNRIEQRLGRLDRFGSGESILSMAVVCEDDPGERVWAMCLDEGFNVFRQSIASLQYLIESSLLQAGADWSGDGITALMHWVSKLGGEAGWVARERRRIDQQDALDSLAVPDDESFERLEDEDAEWEHWRDAFRTFAVDNLQLRVQKESWEGALPRGEEILRLAYEREGSHATLFPLVAFTDHFLGAVDTTHRDSSARRPLTFPYAFRRGSALSRQGMARGVRPLRYGDPLVESLSDFCNTDDRGRSFAMWRHLPNYEARDASGVDMYFRFDVHVEADLKEASHDAGSRAIRRRAAGLLPPQYQTVWVGTDGACSTRPPAELLMGYSPASQVGSASTDYNLNPQRWRALERNQVMPWLSEWEFYCLRARNASVDYLKNSLAMQNEVQRALVLTARLREERLAQLQARARRMEGAAHMSEIKQIGVEAALFDRIARAIEVPDFRVDVAGVAFVSSKVPFVK